MLQTQIIALDDQDIEELDDLGDLPDLVDTWAAELSGPAARSRFDDADTLVWKTQRTRQRMAPLLPTLQRALAHR